VVKLIGADSLKRFFTTFNLRFYRGTSWLELTPQLILPRNRWRAYYEEAFNSVYPDNDNV